MIEHSFDIFSIKQIFQHPNATFKIFRLFVLQKILVKIQYLSFPKRFLLLLEGAEANAKKEILILTRIFCVQRDGIF